MGGRAKAQVIGWFSELDKPRLQFTEQQLVPRPLPRETGALKVLPASENVPPKPPAVLSDCLQMTLWGFTKSVGVAVPWLQQKEWTQAQLKH